jgi:hypothetical protein
MARGLQMGLRLFPRYRVVTFAARAIAIRESVSGVEGARSRATGLVPTQPDGSLNPSRGGLRCNRIQLDAGQTGPTSPVFF